MQNRMQWYGFKKVKLCVGKNRQTVLKCWCAVAEGMGGIKWVFKRDSNKPRYWALCDVEKFVFGDKSRSRLSVKWGRMRDEYKEFCLEHQWLLQCRGMPHPRIYVSDAGLKKLLTEQGQRSDGGPECKQRLKVLFKHLRVRGVKLQSRGQDNFSEKVKNAFNDICDFKVRPYLFGRRYQPDLYCVRYKVAVEYDEFQHPQGDHSHVGSYSVRHNDEKNDALCEKHQIKVVRCKEKDCSTPERWFNMIAVKIFERLKSAE
jgi:hypothetical protein